MRAVYVRRLALGGLVPDSNRHMRSTIFSLWERMPKNPYNVSTRTYMDGCDPTTVRPSRCPTTRACSVFKVCGIVSGGAATGSGDGAVSDNHQDGSGSGSGGTGSSRGGTVADVTPPSLLLSVGEDGVAFTTPSGISGVQHTVYVGSSFVDPGVTAVDQVCRQGACDNAHGCLPAKQAPASVHAHHLTCCAFVRDCV